MSKSNVLALRQTYYMAASELIFQVKEDEPLQSVRLNVIVISKDGKFAVQEIAKAHQATQLQFRKRIDDPTIKILDVVLLGLMKLGEFTDKEFNARPSGLEMVETSEVLNVR